MPTSAEQLLTDALAQLRDEQATANETIDLLRGQLETQVAVNIKLAFQVENLHHTIRQLMRDVNGEG